MRDDDDLLNGYIGVVNDILSTCICTFNQIGNTDTEKLSLKGACHTTIMGADHGSQMWSDER